MKSTHTLNFVKFTACVVLVVGLSASAFASCGDSLSAMAAQAASVHSQSRPIQQNSGSAGDQLIHRWSLAHPVHGRRSNHPGSVPALEFRWDRGSQPEC